jgi:hypothetical protein
MVPSGAVHLPVAPSEAEVLSMPSARLGSCGASSEPRSRSASLIQPRVVSRDAQNVAWLQFLAREAKLVTA